ncbi:MAG TPA: glycosyltransferase family 2 protein [Candidatus Woesebacteria bacterium]|nr:glycosyltransferase family 2 protein [Candidatus Woesebacteria bacterium]
MKLSVVLATFNEEKNLKRCLDSVKELADEIVIVDGSSTDKTVEIAKTFDANVHVTDNPPNFHINKQKAIDRARGDWILQMDADEVVSPELAKEINEVTQKQRADGYWMPRKNYFLGRFLMKGGQYPDYTVRLYRRGKGKLPQKDVHEQAVIEGKVEYLKAALLHYPYENFGHYYMKWKRYNVLFAKQIQDELKGKSVFGKMITSIGYLFLRPAHWFLTTYIRHKGFYDLWPGFVFSLFSALRFPAAYVQMLTVQNKK